MVKWGQIEIGEYYVVTVNDNWRRATLEAISDNQLKVTDIVVHRKYLQMLHSL